MMKGRVKWFNRERGFGFIETDTHCHVLVHNNCPDTDCLIYDLKESDRVLLEVRNTFKGAEAVRVRRFAPEKHCYLPNL
jgi:CspA family cold shock protein